MPIAVTELCMAPHQLYQQSGRLRVRMEDGIDIEAGNAETTAVLPCARRRGCRPGLAGMCASESGGCRAGCG